MKGITKWLKDNNFDFKKIALTGGKAGIMVNTDYEGPYPTRECMEAQQAIEAKVRRYKGIKAEPRGYRSGMLITEA